MNVAKYLLISFASPLSTIRLATSMHSLSTTMTKPTINARISDYVLIANGGRDDGSICFDVLCGGTLGLGLVGEVEHGAIGGLMASALSVKLSMERLEVLDDVLWCTSVTTDAKGAIEMTCI